MLDLAEHHLPLIAAAVAAVGALALVVRRVARWLRRSGHKVNAVYETLVGREAITHPETGEVLAPATPGVGARLAHIEDWQVAATHTLAAMADAQQAIARADGKIEVQSQLLHQHIKLLGDHLQWTEDTAKRDHGDYDRTLGEHGQAIEELQRRVTSIEEGEWESQRPLFGDQSSGTGT